MSAKVKYTTATYVQVAGAVANNAAKELRYWAKYIQPLDRDLAKRMRRAANGARDIYRDLAIHYATMPGDGTVYGLLPEAKA